MVGLFRGLSTRPARLLTGTIGGNALKIAARCLGRLAWIGTSCCTYLTAYTAPGWALCNKDFTLAWPANLIRQAALSLDALAGGNVLSYPAVLAFDAETALLKLTMLSAQAAYQRRLHKLYQSKTE